MLNYKANAIFLAEHLNTCYRIDDRNASHLPACHRTRPNLTVLLTRSRLDQDRLRDGLQHVHGGEADDAVPADHRDPVLPQDGVPDAVRHQLHRP